MKEKCKTFIPCVFFIGILIAFDQFTKYLVTVKLKGNAPFVLINGVFEFSYSENRGAAFGILQGGFILFFIVSLIVVAFVLYALWKMPAERHYIPLRISLIMIAAGAAGNMIDRLIKGYVVDFLYFKLINYPIFNVADSYVTVSVILLLILVLAYYPEKDLDFLKPGRKPDRKES